MDGGGWAGTGWTKGTAGVKGMARGRFGASEAKKSEKPQKRIDKRKKGVRIGGLFTEPTTGEHRNAQYQERNEAREDG
jgi:hypothetical protein